MGSPNDKSRKEIETLLLLGRDYHHCFKKLTIKFDPPCIEKLTKLVKDVTNDEILKLLSNAAKLVPTGRADEAVVAMFLSVCMKSDREGLSVAAYAAFPDICTSSFIFFCCISCIHILINQTNELALGTEAKEKRGMWGSGLRNAINRWYSSKSSVDLTKMLIADQKQFKWTHKDIMKLSHIKLPSPHLQATVSYFAFNKAEALEKLDDDCKELAKKWNELKASNGSDAVRVVYLLKELNIELSPSSHFSNSAKIWTEYLENLPLPKLLRYLEYFSASKRMKQVQAKALTLIKDADGSTIDPFTVYFSLHRYENCNHQSRTAQAIKRKCPSDDPPVDLVESEMKKTWTPYEPCKETVGALNDLLVHSLDALPKTEEDWLVVVDLPHGGCVFNRDLHVPAGVIAAAVVMYAGAVARSVTVVASGDQDIQLDVKSYSNLNEKLAKLKKSIRDPKNSWLKIGLNKAGRATRIIYLSDFLKIDENKIAWNDFTNHRKNNSDLSQLLVVGLNTSDIYNRHNTKGAWIVEGFDTDTIPKFCQLASGKLSLE